MSSDDMSVRRLRETSQEREGRLDALLRARRALSADEIALFRDLYEDFFDAHYARVHSVLARRGVSGDAIGDLVQDVYLTFFNRAVVEGFPSDITAVLDSLAAGKAANHVRGQRREPVSLGMPTSSQEKPRSGPDVDRMLDHAAVIHRILVLMSPEHRAVLSAVWMRELSHQEAADELGLLRSTVTERLKAAKRRFAELAEVLMPPSMRGGR